VIGAIDPAFTRRPDWQSALITLAHIAITYLPIYLAAAQGPSAWLIVYWLWFGLMQNGLINLMHECAHKLAFRSAWLNEGLGGRVLAPLVITDFASYRERHWDHHRWLGTQADPKLVYHTDIRGPRLWMLVLRCAVGIEVVRRLTESPPANDDGGTTAASGKSGGLSLRLVLTQAVFAASIAGVALLAHRGDLFSAALATACAYGGVYGYGSASVTVLAAALRAIAEHQVSGQDAATEGSAALRNLRCNALTRLLFGAYGFGEHATHHRRPGVPYYHLPQLTRELAANDAAFEPGTGYVGMIARLATSQR
jgi:fatty acid desaturase